MRHNGYNRYMRSNYCTDQLPAKRKLLPQPCPICKRDNGTIQLVIFDPDGSSGDIVCRIGHYSSKKYKETKSKLANVRDLKLQRKIRRSGGRIWHQFRMKYLLYEEEMRDNSIIFRYSHDKKMVTLTPNSQFINTVKKYGWNLYSAPANYTPRRHKNWQYD